MELEDSFYTSNKPAIAYNPSRTQSARTPEVEKGLDRRYRDSPAPYCLPSSGYPYSPPTRSSSSSGYLDPRHNIGYPSQQAYPSTNLFPLPTTGGDDYAHGPADPDARQQQQRAASCPPNDPTGDVHTDFNLSGDTGVTSWESSEDPDFEREMWKETVCTIQSSNYKSPPQRLTTVEDLNDISTILNPTGYFAQIDSISVGVAQICRADRLPSYNGGEREPMQDWTPSESNNYLMDEILRAIELMQEQGFCNESIIVFAEHPIRPNVIQAGTIGTQCQEAPRDCAYGSAYGRWEQPFRRKYQI
ncbi:hypothetical protein LTR37_019904 [Vermiconidia calcicola]|uniref:Uncharacterized protein n=1 Tax=Vermiconidia calcicola TaxID=1690605 RepID=A0ACC3MDZ1_9PEZI|nr:hypothetical protein LTR37_019904 [Vermiconidia calcicola]